MKTYQFFCRSTRRGFLEWVVASEDGAEVRRVDRDVQLETTRQFRERVGAELEKEGFVPAAQAE